MAKKEKVVKQPLQGGEKKFRIALMILIGFTAVLGITLACLSHFNII